jgi:hypothetical protein
MRAFNLGFPAHKESDARALARVGRVDLWDRWERRER